MLADKHEDSKFLVQFTLQTEVHCWSWVLSEFVALYVTNTKSPRRNSCMKMLPNLTRLASVSAAAGNNNILLSCNSWT